MDAAAAEAAVAEAAAWLAQHTVLERLLQSNLHQTQYVARVEDVVRFLVEARCLAPQQLAAIWEAQVSVLAGAAGRGCWHG